MLGSISEFVHPIALLVSLVAPLSVAVAFVLCERSRRETYRTVLGACAPGSLLLDTTRAGRTLLVVRSRDLLAVVSCAAPERDTRQS